MWLWGTSLGLFQACSHLASRQHAPVRLRTSALASRSLRAAPFPRSLASFSSLCGESPPQEGLPPTPVCTGSSPIPCPLSALTWVCLSHFNYWKHLLAAWLTLTSRIRGKRCPGISEPRFCSFVALWQALWLPFSCSGNPEIAGGGEGYSVWPPHGQKATGRETLSCPQRTFQQVRQKDCPAKPQDCKKYTMMLLATKFRG